MRNLTDEDIEALASKVIEKAEANFYKGVGQGVWGLIKKALIPLLLVLALYGMSSNKELFQLVAKQEAK